MSLFVTSGKKKVHTNKLGEKELVEGLKDGNGEIIRFVYRRNLPSIKKMLRGFPVSAMQEEDILQEGLVRAITNIKAGKFNGLSSVHSYFYAICKNICLHEYRKLKQFEQLEGELPVESCDEDHYYDLLSLVLEVKSRLSKDCNEIIEMRFRLREENSVSDGSNRLLDFETIAARIGIKPDNARQRFSRCLEKLISAVQNEKGIEEFTANG